ncbi:ABC transporter permease [Ruminococcus sp.]|uniref:ABC transporter permease n=1 Tax=Ruminococcus sp. TaxID=41978 RepID=UPI0025F7FC60|nr:ABC transporter permease [Ruminococcus sp.]MBQ8967823.1 FtsX-like permease family protein [Ruminococcus sp.]
MKGVIRLALRYLRYYKSQTAALFLGIVLAAALFSGLGGLLGSGRKAAAENARVLYGDWHYCLTGEAADTENTAGSGFSIEKTGRLYLGDIVNGREDIRLACADEGYLDMMFIKAEEGHLPQNADEIAADENTLRTLGAKEGLGETLQINGESFTVCGITDGLPEKLAEQKDLPSMVFVNAEDSSFQEFNYIKFNETRKVYKQMMSLCSDRKLSFKELKQNLGLCELVGGESPARIFEVFKAGLSQKEMGLPYIWGTLNGDGALAEGVILLGTGIFGILMIYSLYRVTLRKRLSQYSVMETLGMTDGYKAAVLFTELFMLGLAGYPVGCLVGNAAAYGIYSKVGRIFVTRNTARHTGGSSFAEADLPDAGNYVISTDIMLFGSAALTAVFILIAALLVMKMRKHSLRQMIAENTDKKRSRKIYSLRRSDLSGIVAKRFMFPTKAGTAGSMLSLAVGSVLFLGSVFVTENTRRNNQLTFKADDGLGSDMQVMIDSENYDTVVSQDRSEALANISGISSCHAVRYTLGEIEFKDGAFKWTEFYPELCNYEDWQQDPDIMERFGGIAVKSGEDSYKLKVNIYGYDDQMLAELGDYLFEGTIDPDAMRRDDTVIFKPLMDGQGNYDGADVSLGDTLTIKTIRPDSPPEAMRFEGDESLYDNDDLSVSAIVSRPLAKVDDLIGDDGTDTIDVIMTCEQMERYFSVTGSRTISISLENSENSRKVYEQVCLALKGAEGCIVKDYTEQIARQDLYLSQKMFFFYGISAVIFGVSLIHIMNSLQYFITSKRREFGILRAMGMTDAGLRRMLALQGARYGLLSSAVIAVMYLAVQKMLFYFMTHVYLYIHPNSFISYKVLFSVLAANIAVCILVSVLAGRSVLKTGIIEEIKE